jgi:hypothetical protein
MNKHFKPKHANVVKVELDQDIPVRDLVRLIKVDANLIRILADNGENLALDDVYAEVAISEAAKRMERNCDVLHEAISGLRVANTVVRTVPAVPQEEEEEIEKKAAETKVRDTLHKCLVEDGRLYPTVCAVNDYGEGKIDEHGNYDNSAYIKSCSDRG